MRLLFGRFLIAFICATSVLPVARAEAPSYITDWAELLPKGLYDFFPEDMTTALWVDPTFQQRVAEAERKTRPDVHNRPILLPGYMVPLVYDGDDVREFLLVPSAGQCIHVPPPPVNQTIFVALAKPTRIRTYGEPVIVEGRLLTVLGQTDYAETGYRIEASEVQDFNFDVWDKIIDQHGMQEK